MSQRDKEVVGGVQKETGREEKVLKITDALDHVKSTLASISELLAKDSSPTGIITSAIVTEEHYRDYGAAEIAKEIIFFLNFEGSPLRQQSTDESLQELPYGSEVIQSFLTTDTHGNTFLLQVDRTPASEGYARLNVRMKPFGTR